MAFKEAIKQQYENIKTLESLLASAVTSMAIIVRDEVKRNPDVINTASEETNVMIRNVMGKHQELWNPEAFKRRS